MGDNSNIIDLFRITLRHFYKPGCIILYDILLENHILKEEELLKKINLVPKEVNKYIFILKNDRLIKHETVEEDELPVTYYYIDYYEAYLIIKFKIFSMMKNLELQMKKQNCEPIFFCADCEINFDLLEVQETMIDFKFICPHCGAQLEDKVINQLSHKNYKRVAKKLSHIFELLRKLEGKKIQQINLKTALDNRKNKQNLLHKKLRKEEAADEFEEITFKVEEDRAVENIEEGKKYTYKGAVKYIKDITDDDLDNMTESEYEKYFEAYELIK